MDCHVQRARTAYHPGLDRHIVEIMGTIRDQKTSQSVLLRSRTLVGRSPRADVRLRRDGASNEHALIYWDGRDWTLRDLSSRNGTLVNHSVLRGNEQRLQPGDAIVFGDPDERWLWHDSAHPKISARRSDGTLIESQDSILCLPNAETPCASIFVKDEHWELDTGQATRPVSDGEVITIDDQSYELALPALHPMSERTRTCGDDGRISAAELHLRVSQNEEYIELVLRTGRGERHLPARAFHYMLLVLARIRQSDLAAGSRAEEAGWTYIHDLAKRLGVSAENVNVDVHRMRQFIARQELFTDPENIVERRRSTGELRIGMGTIHIGRI
jgi:hypothetical protein